jgi:hypothetical protein
LRRATPPNGNPPDLGEDQEAVVQPGAAVISELWIGEAVGTVSALEARITGCLPFPNAQKDRLESAVYTQANVLQDLSVDLGVCGQGLLDARQTSLLLVVGNTDATHLPRLASLTKSSVIDVTTEQQHALKAPLLFRRRLEFVLEGLANALFFHIALFCLTGRKVASIRTFAACKGHPAFIHGKSKGLSSRFL